MNLIKKGIIPSGKMRILGNYERAKRTNSLLSDLYGSSRRHSINSKTFKKNRKKVGEIFMTILELDEPFKKMNRSGPTVTLFDNLFLGQYKR